MDNNFVNRRDRIVASAIELISEAGLSSLTTKNLAMKERMSESLLYRYFGGIDEVLVEVIKIFTKFDDSIIATVEAKKITHLEKAIDFLKTLDSYYEGYRELTVVILNYEEFLHNVNTREMVTECIKKRTDFVKKELEFAIEEKEIIDTFSAEELSILFFGGFEQNLLNQRVWDDGKEHAHGMASILDKLSDMIKIK